MARAARRGFTLVELLVAAGIAAVLVALTASAAQRSRAAAARTACQNNLRQIALGLEHFRHTQGTYPLAARLPAFPPGQPRPGLPTALGGFVENNANIFACPADETYFARFGTSYEYADEVGGRRWEEVTADVPSSTVRLAFDAQPFHGAAFRSASRHIAYADTHVE